MEFNSIEEIEIFINRCMDDFPFYAEELLKIQTKDSRTIPFVLNKAQLRVWSIVKEKLDKGKFVRLMILKARQMGMSTLIQGIIFWYITLRKNQNALVAAQDQDSVENMFAKQKFFYKNLPPFFQPLRKISNRKELYFANPDEKGQMGLESKVVVNTAEKAELGRSFTLHLVHMSEFAFWEDLGYEPKKRLIAVNQSVPEVANTFVMIETTANGEGYFKKIWDNDVDEDDQYKNLDVDYEKVFLSWIAEDSYRLPILEEDYFELSDDNDSLFGDEYQESKYISDQIKFWYPSIKEDELFDEIMARLNWRRYMILHKCEKDYKVFQQEYPTIPEQAFCASGSNIFNGQSLNKMLKEAAKPKYLTFDFDGCKSLFAEKHQREIKLKEVLEFFEVREISKSIELFALPEKRYKYAIGADVAEGVKGGDYSSLVCICANTSEEVFSFNGIIDAVSFAYLLFAVGRIYNDALIGVEYNDKGGGACINELQRAIHYPNLYFREDKNTSKYYKREQKYGWKTTRITKQFLVSDMYTAIDSEEITFHTGELIKQLKLLKLFDDGKIGVALPEHDDLAIAAMIALQMVLSVSIPIEKKKEQEPSRFRIDKLVESYEQSKNLSRVKKLGLHYGQI